MYVLVLDTETTGLFPRGATSTPLKPPARPSAPRGSDSGGGDERPLRSASTPSAPHTNNNKTPFNPSTQRGFRHCVVDTVPPTLPYAVQISYAIIDTSSPVFPIVEDYDAIIRISESTPLPAESVAIHGITREMIRAKGVPIEHALSILQRSLDTYDVQLVVGHNIAFDLRVLETERERGGGEHPPQTPSSHKVAHPSPSSEGASSAPLRPPLRSSPSSSPDPASTPLRPPLCPLSAKVFESVPGRSRLCTEGFKGALVAPSFCTARASVGVCNLRVDSMYGGTYLKFGKLGQVFEIMFKDRDAARGVDLKVFEKYMHNSRVDVLMCARVYVWLCYSVDVFDAWYREMQNYADSEFINVDDSHLVGGGGGWGDEAPLIDRNSNSESSASPVRVRGASPLASPRRSDRLRLKRMREQEQGSILVI